MPSTQTKSIRAISIPRYFWVLFMVFSVTSSFLLVDFFRLYAADITILAVHKNEKTSSQTAQVVRTLVEIPKTLGFYNRLLVNYPEIKDPWTSLSSNERESAWAERISMKQIESSDMMVLSVSAQTASDATFLTEKSANTLFRLAGQHYDLRTDLDLRVLERREAHTIIASPFLWFVSSVLSGAVFAFTISSIMQYIFSMIEKFSLRRKELQKMVPGQPVHFDDMKQSEVADKQTEVVKNEIGQSQSNETAELPIVSPKTSNLPLLEEGVSLEEYIFGATHNASQNMIQAQDNTAEEVLSSETHTAAIPSAFDMPVDTIPERDGILNTEQTQETEQKITQKNEDTKTSSLHETQLHSEPTLEEYKKRLNELLRGK